MAKVTSKLQVTVPKALAAQLGIRPGDDVDWTINGNSLHVNPSISKPDSASSTRRRNANSAASGMSG